MSQILVYSRAQNDQINASIQTLCEKLNEVGHQTEHTFSTNWARVFLNHYDVIHLFVEKFPLTVQEIFFISLAKALGKPTVLSLFDSELRLTRPLAALACPDALTVSQTNHFQYYRDWICTKSLLPLLPAFTAGPNAPYEHGKPRPYLIPIEKKLEEVFLFTTKSETYFDARLLTKNHSSTELRKKWNRFLQAKKINANAHLILSEEKIATLLDDENLQVVLASPSLNHTTLTMWLGDSLNKGHLIFLNEFQATSFSHAWVSGRNCEVLTTRHWPQAFNHFVASETKTEKLFSRLKNSEFTEPLINEISRLYSKIIRQKTLLISSESKKHEA